MARAPQPESGGGSMDVHAPVMTREVLALLAGEQRLLVQRATAETWIVDATVGAGGHAAALLAACPHVHLLGIDQDPEILDIARVRLAEHSARVVLEHARMSSLETELDRHGIERVQAMLIDLGASSLQLDRPERGFSFQADGPLDMRMDPTRERTAADIVNHWDEADLADLFYYEGGEPGSRRVARAVADARRRAPFLRTLALAAVVERALGGRRGRLHPATRVFQALRRAVNEEGEELLLALAAADARLASGGRLAVLAFHSGEDAVVKRHFAAGARAGSWSLLTRKPVRAGRDEVLQNPRARSASLRAAERRHGEGG
jgi:16S rRNA (cytosine1402-N4)-methyltransferase